MLKPNHAHSPCIDRHVLIITPFGVEHCQHLILGDALNSGLGNPLIVHGSSTYTCLNDCTATEENSPALWYFLKIGNEEANVTEEFLLHAVCGFNCRYNGVGLEARA